jgi:hypothetical protein
MIICVFMTWRGKGEAGTFAHLIIIIDTNNLLSSFDPVQKNDGDCLGRESSQNFLDNIRKSIDLGNESRSELTLRSGENMRRCNIRAERPIGGAFEI